MQTADTILADTLASGSAALPVVDDASATGGGRPRSDDADELPPRVGRYHVLGRLGSGGMGVVYSAYDPDLDRRVAVKLLRTDRGGRDSQLRLLREAQALARLSHPNVVQIYDTDALGEQVFIAMEFIRGVDLHAWLGAARRSTEEVMRVFLDAGRGLAAAHEVGLVHRDFKPDNVLVGDDGRVCVADFGLARDGGEEASAADGGSARPLDMSLTATGALLGTPTYMSPEQHEGRVADARSDQFSFCVALWEALYGRRPFDGDSHAQIAVAVTAGEIADPPADARGPRRLISVLRRGLVVAPEGRWPSMHVLLAALAPTPRRARWRWLTAIALAGSTCGAGLALASWRAREASACSGGPGEVAAAYDADDRVAVTDALAARPDRETAPRVVAALDAYANAWVAAHHDACLVHRREEQSTALFDARTRCLHQRRAALASAVRLLRAPAAETDADQLVARLPALAGCSDAGVVMAEVAPPDDPALAAAVASAGELLISARTRMHAGDLRGAEAAAADAITEARRLGFRPLLAAALLALGTIESSVANGPAARAHLAEAAAVAVATRQDAIAAEALARQIFVEVVHLSGDAAAALAAVPLAHGFAERLPAPAAALARVASNEGTAHLARADRDRAAEAFARAVAHSDLADDVDPIERAHYLQSLAYTTDDPRRQDELFARSEAELGAVLGPQHPFVLRQRLLRARLAPDLAAARDLLRTTCPALRERAPEDANSCGVCNYTLAHLELRLGRTAEAADALAATRSCAEGQPPKADSQLQAHGAAALAATLAGDDVGAVAIIDACLQTFAEYRDRPWTLADLAELELTRGRALLRLGERDEALAGLERSVEGLAAPHPGERLTLPKLWLADARALLARARDRP